MNIRNLQNMIAECINYADAINSDVNLYPDDAKMQLRDLLRYDIIIFLGFLYEPDNGNLKDQVEFIRLNLRMNLSDDKFLEFVEQRCFDPRFLTEAPKSLSYFIKADRASMQQGVRGNVAKSKFVVDCFRKLGEGFISYDRVKDETKKKLTDYIEVLYATLNSAGIVTTTHTSVLTAAMNPHSPSSMPEKMPQAPVKESKITTFDVDTGEFVVKNKISISGHNIVKKRADDITEFQNFVKAEEEEVKDAFHRGKTRVGGNRRGSDESEEIEASLDELIKELQGLTGLGSVKEDVMHLINIIKVRKLREMKGLKRIDMSFHLVFTGNPGTGKTTIARLLAKIYKQLGVVSKGQFIEVDRSGLVAHYSGGTAIKTTEVIDRAVGGILFIDEAYSLTHNKEMGDYGQEAVDTLLKRMEDDRDDLIVIVAGYTNEMREFINSNPGLQSRFNKYIEFPDYTSQELMTIFKHMCDETDYSLTESAAIMADTYLTGLAEGKKDNFANARLVRNYFERCIDRQANRIVKDKLINEDDLVTFVREDMIEPNTTRTAIEKNPDA